MSAFSAAAQDEDGDIISALRARVADLEAQLYAVGAGGVGSPVARQDHPEQRLDMVPAGWKLVPVEPTIPMLHRADGLTCIDFAALGEEGAFDLDELKEIYRAMLAAAPQPPVSHTATPSSCGRTSPQPFAQGAKNERH